VTGPWPRLHDERDDGTPDHPAPVLRWELHEGPDAPWLTRTPAAARTRAPVPAAPPRRWPELPDDTQQWQVTPRRSTEDRIRRLDEEQRGLPWNA